MTSVSAKIEDDVQLPVAAQLLGMGRCEVQRLGKRELGHDEAVAGQQLRLSRPQVIGPCSAYLARRGWKPEVLKVVSRVANLFPPALATLGPLPPVPADPDADPAGSSPDSPSPGQLKKAADQLSPHGLGIEDLEAYLKTRSELYEADLRFGEVGPGSIFGRLDAAGRWSHALSCVGDIAGAIEDPPGRGRARLRSAVVRRLSGKRGCLCDWESVITPAGCLDMSDPLGETEGEWREHPKRERSGGGLVRRLAELVD